MRHHKAFTLIELMVAIAIAGIMLGAALVVWYGFSRRTDTRAAAEIIMQDIREVYEATNAAITHGYEGPPPDMRFDQYRLLINTKSDSPSSAYRIERRVFLETKAWGEWEDVDVGKVYNSVIRNSGKTWIRPSSSSDFEIVSVTDGNGQDIYSEGTPAFVGFIHKGSITGPVVLSMESPAVTSQPITIVCRSSSQDKTVKVCISNLGEVWATED